MFFFYTGGINERGQTHHIPSEKIIAKGKGATNPIADNSTIEGRKKNRRVVIYVLNK